jgi:hypothetical protein
MDDRLRRNTTPDETGSAQLVGLDERRVEPELSGPDTGHVPARAATDDEDFGAEVFDHGEFQVNGE